jgi:hypothetical protein
MGNRKRRVIRCTSKHSNFHQNFYSDFLDIMNFCGSLWIQKTWFSVYSKLWTILELWTIRLPGDNQGKQLVHSYLHYQEQCLPTRFSQNTLKGSTINRRLNNNIKYGENCEISLEIPREFLSGNWQYRSNSSALPNASLFCSLLHSGNKKKKNYFTSSSTKKRRETLFWSVMFIAWYTQS